MTDSYNMINFATFAVNSQSISGISRYVIEIIIACLTNMRILAEEEATKWYISAEEII